MSTDVIDDENIYVITDKFAANNYKTAYLELGSVKVSAILALVLRQAIHLVHLYRKRDSECLTLLLVGFLEYVNW